MGLPHRSHAVQIVAASAALTALVSAASLGARGQSAPASPAPLSFNRDIRPILSDNCFACHGPDENKRKAKLRLDLEKEAFRVLTDGRFAIIRGDASRRELVRRVMTTDPADFMPPPQSTKELSSQQNDVMKRWDEAEAR